MTRGPGVGRAPRSGRTGAIVLAGGRSSRFGADKLSIAVRGRPLVDHAIDAARAVADLVVVVLPPGSASTVHEGVVAVHDERPFEGPLAGVLAGLGGLDQDVADVIVIAGDSPCQVPAVLRRLLSVVRSDVPEAAEGADAAVLMVEGDARPLPLAVRRDPAEREARRIRDAGGRRLRDLVSALDARVIEEEAWRADDPTGQTLLDVDLPADLDRVDAG